MTEALTAALAVPLDELRRWRDEIAGSIEPAERELRDARAALALAEEEHEEWLEGWRRISHRVDLAVGGRAIACAFDNRLTIERRRQEEERRTGLSVGGHKQVVAALEWKAADLHDAIRQIDDVIAGRIRNEGSLIIIDLASVPMLTGPAPTYDPLVYAIPHEPAGGAASVAAAGG